MTITQDIAVTMIVTGIQSETDTATATIIETVQGIAIVELVSILKAFKCMSPSTATNINVKFYDPPEHSGGSFAIIPTEHIQL